VLNISVVSFSAKFGLIFKGLEDMATKGIHGHSHPPCARTLANIPIGLITPETKSPWRTFPPLTV